jgi:hypothetical protein
VYVRSSRATARSSPSNDWTETPLEPELDAMPPHRFLRSSPTRSCGNHRTLSFFPDETNRGVRFGLIRIHQTREGSSNLCHCQSDREFYTK